MPSARISSDVRRMGAFPIAKRSRTGRLCLFLPHIHCNGVIGPLQVRNRGLSAQISGAGIQEADYGWRVQLDENTALAAVDDDPVEGEQ